MPTFLSNWLIVLAILCGLGLAGSFATFCFEDCFKFRALTAPMFGVLFLSLGTMTVYVVLRVPVKTAGLVTLLGLWSISAITIYLARGRRRLRLSITALILTLAVSAILTAVETASSIKFGEPSLLILDGADHLNYSQVVDWLLAHRVTQAPQVGPDLPYESIVNLLYAVDPRFGAYGFLATLCELTKQSAAFTFDLACAAAMSVGILAVSAAFARSKKSLILLCSGLLTCHWFDYSRAGFLAKILSYPAIFFMAGLFLAACRLRWSPLRIAILIVATEATALLQSGMTEGLFLGLFGGAFLLLGPAFKDADLPAGKHLHACWVMLGLFVVVAILASGTVARPLALAYPSWGYPWHIIYPRLAELENMWVDVTRLTGPWLEAFLIGSLLLWLCLGALAVYSRSATGTAFVLAPMLLLVVLRAANATDTTFQMIGIFYPAALLGSIVTLDLQPEKTRTREESRLLNIVVVSWILLAIGLHLPRTIGAINRFCINVPVQFQVVHSQIKKLRQLVRKQSVSVDVGDTPQLSKIVLTELADDCELQFSARDWKNIFWYRKWPVPQYSSPASFRLLVKGAAVPEGYVPVYSTNQYLLLKSFQ